MTKGGAAEHRKELDALKTRDPEFYKFLEANDRSLLDFTAEGEGDEEPEGEEQGENENAKKQKKRKRKSKKPPVSLNDEKAIGDDAAEGGDGGEDEPTEEQDEGNEGVVLTTRMLSLWQTQLETSPSLRNIDWVVRAFECACHVGDREQEEGGKYNEFQIQNAGVFDRLMVFCVKRMDHVFDAHMGIQTDAAEEENTVKKKKKSQDSAARLENNPLWKKLKHHVKKYLISALYFLEQAPEGKMAGIVLAQLARMWRYINVWHVLGRKLLRAALKFWAGGPSNTEQAQVQAYLFIRSLAINISQPFMDLCLKGTYLTYARNSKRYSPYTVASISFMATCVCELYGLDFSASYQHAFVYLRQMAILLRTAITSKKKVAQQAVYNWQFINSLRVWGLILSTYTKASELRPLIYPFCQLVTGTIRLMPTARFYPLRFTCVRFLNELSNRGDVFVPVAPYLLEVFHSAELNRKPSPSSRKPMDLRFVLAMPKSIQHSKVFHEAIVHDALELLLEHLSHHAYSIAFPELAFPAIVALKKFQKETPIQRFRKQVLSLVEKLQRNSEYISQKRQAVDFSPNEKDKVAAFLKEAKAKDESPLAQFLKVERKRIALRRQDLEVIEDGDKGEEEEEEEEEEEVCRCR